jgi:hypothetical protein
MEERDLTTEPGRLDGSGCSQGGLQTDHDLGELAIQGVVETDSCHTTNHNQKERLSEGETLFLALCRLSLS